ncbi:MULTISPECIES: hypothetical protein [Virgibacillus]|uniref:hypothetical protein n=1 Tax=Virgibacillus TaxID=84406 RepID=UPI00095680E7|nr:MULTISPECIES: hypothetical protein [Virgibacillus]MBS7429367.1 hypothetical protein [Virgibacillus sp. 19R1-5]MED3737804.1 hypothetical protein [Virgibacillus pantothenticus]QTY15121.1 hypothetical protein KBP50_14525 [Virgibacillus pantothenticus]SIT14033.1 hypothetical protein SAMN05421787_12117 [Virgibacillus pantothenticus]
MSSWKDYLETNSQKEALKKQIKQDLQENGFIENIIQLKEMDRVYNANYEHVKLKQGFW